MQHYACQMQLETFSATIKARAAPCMRSLHELQDCFEAAFIAVDAILPDAR